MGIQIIANTGTISKQETYNQIMFEIQKRMVDIENNREQKITWEEKTVLRTLAKSLGLSAEEEKAITFSIVPIEQHNVDEVINSLKETGLAFFNRKTNTI